AHTCPGNQMLLVELLVAETYHEAIASGDQWVKSSFDSLCAHQKITKHQQLAGQLRSRPGGRWFHVNKMTTTHTEKCKLVSPSA
ncbi:MAG: hypothetical protein WA767_08730, partial [Pseudolabrys sp.]